jgi:hypothetical protein
MVTCSVNGCEGRVKTRGFCNKHYIRLLRHGSPDVLLFVRGSLEERFWFHVVKGRNKNACWQWKGYVLPTGYAQIQMGGLGSSHILVHRLSYEIHCGPIPKGMIVMHSCDNPSCANPRHLSLGTHLDNMQDMFAKGRNNNTGRPKGEANGRSVLDETAVRFIRANQTMTYRAIAESLGVSRSAVRDVKVGRTWTHIT